MALKRVSLKSFHCYENCGNIFESLVKEKVDKSVSSSWKTPAGLAGGAAQVTEGATTADPSSHMTGVQTDAYQQYDHIASLVSRDAERPYSSHVKRGTVSATVPKSDPKVSFLTSPVSRRSTRSSVASDSGYPDFAAMENQYFQATQAQTGSEDEADEDLVNISTSEDSAITVQSQDTAAGQDTRDDIGSPNNNSLQSNHSGSAMSRSAGSRVGYTYNSASSVSTIVGYRVAGWSDVNETVSDQTVIDNLKKNRVSALAHLHGSADKSMSSRHSCDHIDVQV